MDTARSGHLRRNWFYFLTDAGLAELSRSARGLPGMRWALRGTLVLAAWGLFYVVRNLSHRWIGSRSPCGMSLRDYIRST